MKFNIDFHKYRKIAFLLSIILTFYSLFLFIKNNLNLGIDFKGGIMVEAGFSSEPNLSVLRDNISKLSIGNVEIQEFGDPRNILFRIEKQDKEKDQKNVINKLKAELPEDIDYRRIEFVGPKVGKELQIMGFKAVMFSLMAMFVYIWFRFIVLMAAMKNKSY